MEKINLSELKCVGGIIGDIVGKPYEFHPTKDVGFIYMKMAERFTDDSLMTVANMDWLVNDRDLSESMRDWGGRYKVGFGPSFRAWLSNPGMGAYNSFGNGSGMRVSPVGWWCDTLEDTLSLAEESAIVTHNHPEGVKGAKCIAGCIWMARNGKTKDEIKSFCSSLGYDMDRKLSDIRPTYKFEVSCQKSVPESVLCFLEGGSYEDVIRLAISLGGDADTQACMAGSIAEAFGYEIPDRFLGRLYRCADDMLEMIVKFNEKLREKENGTVGN